MLILHAFELRQRRHFDPRNREKRGESGGFGPTLPRKTPLFLVPSEKTLKRGENKRTVRLTGT
jgi:hypothetical protein